MINKKLIHFNTKSKFEEKESEIPETSIVFVKDANEIYTHGEEYQWVGWTVIGTVGSPEPPVDIPSGYTYVQPLNEDWWTDSEDKVILVME